MITKQVRDLPKNGPKADIQYFIQNGLQITGKIIKKMAHNISKKVSLVESKIQGGKGTQEVILARLEITDIKQERFKES